MTLEECRQFYAEEVRLAASVRSPALIEAFARVPRERYLGPGPWKIASPDMGMGGVTYIATEDADPRRIHHNVVVALDASRHLTNGQPGTLARWIDTLDLRPGEKVFHLGCGVGYYTAIIAEVVGATGQVVGSEVDPALAARAKENLAAYPNVDVHTGDGAQFDPGFRDAMLINAGVTHPHPAWLARLRDGGRMILPLTVAMGPQWGPTLGRGLMVMITRGGGSFSARVVTPVGIYSCASVRDPRLEPMLVTALTTGTLLRMKSVRLDAHEPAESCVLHGEGVCLTTA